MSYSILEKIDTQKILDDQKMIISKKRELQNNNDKIQIESLPDFKTTSATIRHALIRKGIYLPNHNKKKTSLHFMKKIIKGEKKYLLTKDVIFVDVPHYDELKPENVIEKCHLEKDQIWPRLSEFCPELRDRKNRPKDRTFFYNVLNTLKPKFIDTMVINAIHKRD